MVTRYESPFDDEERYLRDRPGAYKFWEDEDNGEPCWFIEIKRVNPPYRASYQMRWRVPNERDLTLPAEKPHD